MDKFGFKNFRKFVKFPEIALGGVNILVGTNNAGKSTFAKAACIYLDFLKKWDNGDITLDFDSDICRRLNINSFGDALSRFADEKGEKTITFSMTIGRYSYKAVFEGEKNQTKVNAKTMTLVDQENKNEFVFDYGKDSITTNIASAIYGLKTDYVEDLRRFLLTPKGAIAKAIKRKVEEYDLVGKLDKIENDINSEITEETIGVFDKIEEIAEGGSIVAARRSHYHQFMALREYARQIFGVNTIVRQKYFFSSVASRRNVLDVISKQIDADIYVPSNATDDFEKGTALENIYFDYCRAISVTQKKVYTIYDTDELSQTIARFMHATTDENRKKDAMGFVNFWLNELKIGTRLSIENLDNSVVFRCFIEDDNNNSIPVYSLGMGSIHILILLLKVAIFAVEDTNKRLRINLSAKKGTNNTLTLFVEEPELNLHPMIQSRLADLFYAINKDLHIQLVVETHSEYLVRRSQVLASTDCHEYHYDEQTFEKAFPFKVYYIGDQGPYQMKYAKTGQFRSKFGEGFFDESINLIDDMFNIWKND